MTCKCKHRIVAEQGGGDGDGPALAIIYIYLLAAYVRRVLARVGECGAARHSARALLTGWDQLLKHQLVQNKVCCPLPVGEGQAFIQAALAHCLLA